MFDPPPQPKTFFTPFSLVQTTDHTAPCTRDKLKTLPYEKYAPLTNNYYTKFGHHIMLIQNNGDCIASSQCYEVGNL